MSALRMERIYQRYFSLHENKKVICIALNYPTGQPAPSPPSFFDKPYSSIITSGQSLMLAPH